MTVKATSTGLFLYIFQKVVNPRIFASLYSFFDKIFRSASTWPNGIRFLESLLFLVFLPFLFHRFVIIVVAIRKVVHSVLRRVRPGSCGVDVGPTFISPQRISPNR